MLPYSNKLKNVFVNDFSKDIIKIFKKSDFLISASLKEAQSLVIIQALASGKPVIGLENETITELINNKNGKSLPKKTTPKKFAYYILDFVKNCNYKSLSKNARQDASKFKIENVSLEIEKMYDSATHTNSKYGRRNVSKYYQEILKRIIVQK